MQLFLKIVHTWHHTVVAKIRSRALKTALYLIKNVFRSNKNVVYNVEKYLEALKIIVVIVQMLYFQSLVQMIIKLIIHVSRDIMI
jgi:hypothetical protein